MLTSTVNRMLARYGQRCTLRRDTPAAGANAWTKGASVLVYHGCVAREHGQLDLPLDPGTTVRASEYLIDAASVATKPKIGDRFATGEYTSDGAADWASIVGVEERREAGTARLYVVRVQR